mgnify:CR=1 FL=1
MTNRKNRAQGSGLERTIARHRINLLLDDSEAEVFDLMLQWITMREGLGVTMSASDYLMRRGIRADLEKFAADNKLKLSPAAHKHRTALDPL